MYSMSVKMHYGRTHLIWAAYMLLQDEEHLKVCHFPSGLSKKFIRDYLREQMSMFGSDECSLFGSNYSEEYEGTIGEDLRKKATEWVDSRCWDK